MIIIYKRHYLFNYLVIFVATKNAARDMKKVRKHFAVSEKNSIFANANIENTSCNAHFGILHDRQERADLIESGKFVAFLSGPQKVALESSLVCPVSFLKDTDCFTIFVLQVYQNLIRRICEGGVSFLRNRQ